MFIPEGHTAVGYENPCTEFHCSHGELLQMEIACEAPPEPQPGQTCVEEYVTRVGQCCPTYICRPIS